MMTQLRPLSARRHQDPVDRRLRLLQLVQVYPPAMGGVPHSVSGICERLVSDYGADVSVFTTNALTTLTFRDASLPTLPLGEAEEMHGVRIRRFPVATRWAPWLRYPQSVAYRLGLPVMGDCVRHGLVRSRRGCFARFGTNRLTSFVPRPFHFIT